MISLIIFDMAGTSIDEDNIVYKTILESIRSFRIDVDLDTVLKIGAGKEKRTAIKDIYLFLNGEAPDEELIDEIHNDFIMRLAKAYEVNEMRVFPGVLKLIEFCRPRDIRVAFNTGYKRAMALNILEKVKIKEGEDIDILVAADDVKNGRPAPDMINLICDKLEIDPIKAIKIGDSGIDIEEGRNAGVKYTIGITTGAQTRELLLQNNPDFIVNDAEEIISIIENAN